MVVNIKKTVLSFETNYNIENCRWALLPIILHLAFYINWSGNIYHY